MKTRLATSLVIITIAFLPSSLHGETRDDLEAQKIPEQNSVTLKMYFPSAYAKATITGYSAVETCGDHRRNCITASGDKPGDRTMACPRNIPFNSFVLYDGTVYRCKDRTNKLYDGRFDIWFGYDQEAYKKAIKFGIKKDQKITVFTKQ